MLKRRQQKTMAREGEILRYWVESSNACLIEGVFTAEDSEVAAVSRGILAASAVLRPALRHISQRIRDADDRGAVKLFNPVMRMVEGVLKKLFLGTNETVRSSCLKFMEIVVLCFSYKPEDPNVARRRGQHVSQKLTELPDADADLGIDNRRLLSDGSSDRTSHYYSRSIGVHCRVFIHCI